MHTSNRFTVVTPVYNGERYVAETIQSVIGQTFSGWEYIIMDGGSTDRTLEIAQSYASRDTRIMVFSQRDRGMYDAVLTGLAHGTAPVCCWINADDKLLPWALELVNQYMVATDAQWVTGIPGYWDEKGRLWSVGSIPWYPRPLIRAGFFQGRGLGWIQQESTFFTRALLAKVDAAVLGIIQTQRLAGDFLLWTEFARHTYLRTIPTVLSGFRLHADNMSTLLADRYFAEIKEFGFRLPGPLLTYSLKPIYALAKLVWARQMGRQRFGAINRFEWVR